MCCCTCDYLILDFIILILRGFTCCDGNTYDAIFLLRCLIGFFFDIVEFLILTYTVDDLVYAWFVAIFGLDVVFIVVVIVFIINEKRVSNCLFSLGFKGLSLAAAVVIFVSAYDDFDVKNIESHFNNLDSTDIRQILEEIVLIASFLDICFNSLEILLNLVQLCFAFRKQLFTLDLKEDICKGCCETLKELTTRKSDPPRNSNRVYPSTSESSNGDEMEISSIDSYQHDSEKA